MLFSSKPTPQICGWHPICKTAEDFALYALVVRSEAEINAAIRDCLDTFQPGGSAIAHLAAYLDRLRRKSWAEDDIAQVETGTRRILTKLIDDEGEDEAEL